MQLAGSLKMRNSLDELIAEAIMNENRFPTSPGCPDKHIPKEVTGTAVLSWICESCESLSKIDLKELIESEMKTPCMICGVTHKIKPEWEVCGICKIAQCICAQNESDGGMYRKKSV